MGKWTIPSQGHRLWFQCLLSFYKGVPSKTGGYSAQLVAQLRRRNAPGTKSGNNEGSLRPPADSTIPLIVFAVKAGFHKIYNQLADEHRHLRRFAIQSPWMKFDKTEFELVGICVRLESNYS